MDTNTEWFTAVVQELGLEGALDASPTAGTVDGFASRVADGVGAETVALTTFLLGAAAGRADDPAVAARDYAEKLTHLAGGWNSDEERGEAANDQSARA